MKNIINLFNVNIRKNIKKVNINFILIFIKNKKCNIIFNV